MCSAYISISPVSLVTLQVQFVLFCLSSLLLLISLSISCLSHFRFHTLSISPDLFLQLDGKKKPTLSELCHLKILPKIIPSYAQKCAIAKGHAAPVFATPSHLSLSLPLTLSSLEDLLAQAGLQPTDLCEPESILSACSIHNSS